MVIVHIPISGFRFKNPFFLPINSPAKILNYPAPQQPAPGPVCESGTLVPPQQPPSADLTSFCDACGSSADSPEHAVQEACGPVGKPNVLRINCPNGLSFLFPILFPL